MRDYVPHTPLLSVASVNLVRAPFPLEQHDTVHVVAFQLPAGASYQQSVSMCHAFFRILHIPSAEEQRNGQPSKATLLSGECEGIQQLTTTENWSPYAERHFSQT